MHDGLKIVFIGTSSFAVPVLEALFLSDQIQLQAVITQPDRPAGRNHHIRQSPVKQCALLHGVSAIFQPEDKTELEQCVHQLELDMILVVSYGMIVSRSVLSVPRYGCVNIHGSLLPRYRGASPIQEALLLGEENTGISWIVMDEKMDHGAIIAQEPVEIVCDDTASTLSDRLARTAADMTVTILVEFAQGKRIVQEQDHNKATYTQKITKESGHVDWNKSADEIERMIRAYSPWPGVFCFYHNKRLLIHKARVIEIPEAQKNTPCGTVFLAESNVGVVCGNQTALQIDTIQIEGKSPLPSSALLRGYPDFVGSMLE